MLEGSLFFLRCGVCPALLAATAISKAMDVVQTDCLDGVPTLKQLSLVLDARGAALQFKGASEQAKEVKHTTAVLPPLRNRVPSLVLYELKVAGAM